MPLHFYPGLFTSKNSGVVGKQKGIMVEDRSALGSARRVLAACQNLSLLQERILEFGFKIFSVFGKYVVYAGFWQPDRYISLTIPQSATPLPEMASRYVRIGGEATFPLQPKLIQAAIERKEIVRSGSRKEEFLALPLVSEDGERVMGALLLSNRLTQGRMPVTDSDVETARAFGEMAAEALARFC